MVLVGELDDLIFDRRTVANTGSIDLAAIHRGPSEVRIDNGVGFRVGLGKPTVHLLGADSPWLENVSF